MTSRALPRVCGTLVSFDISKRDGDKRVYDVVEDDQRLFPSVAVFYGQCMGAVRNGGIDVDGHIVVPGGISVRLLLEGPNLLTIEQECHIGVGIWTLIAVAEDAVDVHRAT